ncbi:MAG: tetraacyldisaccharide 4'-kinase [Burkholderiaceae bacterium]|nr:tetraacyldisaccharide 4'-kinase [Burkholderiaceae bacterium]
MNRARFAMSRPRLRSFAESVLLRAWQRRGALAWLLLPLSLVYRALVAARRALFAAGVLRQVQMPVPVVVVGNLFVGGTGKTPLVIWLVGQLRARGFTPGVVARGYRASVGHATEVGAASSPLEVGDEPLLVAQKTGAPVVVGRQRAAAARRLLAAHPEVDVILADDGLQHYALARQVEIALSDARGHGNGWLLPAGPLREPASRRCDFRVVNDPRGAPPGSYAMRLVGDHAEQVCDRTQRMPLSALPPGARIAAAAGIGHPQRFFDMLAARGVRLSATLALPDHHDFSVDPFAALEADIILITDKDAVKCARIATPAGNPRLWTVPVTAVVDGALADNIVEKLRGHPTA